MAYFTGAVHLEHPLDLAVQAVVSENGQAIHLHLEAAQVARFQAVALTVVVADNPTAQILDVRVQGRIALDPNMTALLVARVAGATLTIEWPGEPKPETEFTHTGRAILRGGQDVQPVLFLVVEGMGRATEVRSVLVVDGLDLRLLGEGQENAEAGERVPHEGPVEGRMRQMEKQRGLEPDSS